MASRGHARLRLAQGIGTTEPAIRRTRTESAIALVQAAKAARGRTMNIQLGAENSMF